MSQLETDGQNSANGGCRLPATLAHWQVINPAIRDCWPWSAPRKDADPVARNLKNYQLGLAFLQPLLEAKGQDVSGLELARSYGRQLSEVIGLPIPSAPTDSTSKDDRVDSQWAGLCMELISAYFRSGVSPNLVGALINGMALTAGQDATALAVILADYGIDSRLRDQPKLWRFFTTANEDSFDLLLRILRREEDLDQPLASYRLAAQRADRQFARQKGYTTPDH